MGRNLADVEYKMRMTQDLKEKIVASAKEHNRSMNADIIARLEKSFAENPPQEPKRTSVVNSEFIEEKIGISDQAIDKIADKVIERLNKNKE